MDHAERWLKKNDPEYKAHNRKNLENPYLTEGQMKHRLGAPNVVGEEIPVSNIIPLKDELGFNDRDGKGNTRVKELLELFL